MLSLHRSVRKHTDSVFFLISSEEKRMNRRAKSAPERPCKKHSGFGLTLLLTLALTGATQPLHAQQLTHIDPLFFTMPEFGNAPPGQVIEATSSTGGAVNTYVSVSTGTGGAWLHVSSGGYNNTPFAEFVSIDPTIAKGLLAGTYTGEVVIAPSDGTAPLTIPVTLTVAGSGAPFFDNLPGGLSFSLAANGRPPSQVIEVSSAEAGVLNWVVTASTSDGGNWLTASPANGAAPTTVTVGIAAENLPNTAGGIYTGQLLFSSASGSVTVPVTVSVGGTSLVQINPLSFTMPEFGNAPPGQVIEATSSTGGAVNTYVSVSTGTGGAWLHVSSGGYNNTPFAEFVSIDPTIAKGLLAGTYTGEVVITPSDGTAPLTIPVTLTVAPPNVPFLDNLTGGLYFSALPFSGDPTSQAIQIRNEGSGTLDWTVTPTTGDGGNWLTVSAVAGSAPSNLTIGVIAQNLPGSGTATGIYTGQLLIQGDTGSVTVPIVMQVGTDAFAQANGLTFNVPPDGTSNALTVASLGTLINFYASSSTGNGGAWLRVSPGGYSNTPQSETFTVNTSGLARGSYTGEAIFNSGTVAQTVQVTLNVGGLPPSAIVATSGTPQTTQINTSFSSPFVATVTDANSNPIPGELVTFTAPSSGPSGTFSGQNTATATTNAFGQATSPTFTANSIAGSYAVSAIVSGVTTPATFLLTNNNPLISIAITAPNASLVQGTTEQFTATATYTDRTTANITSRVSWNSSTPAVATINSAGVVTAIAVGSTTISASLSSVASNTFVLNVTPPSENVPQVVSYNVLFGTQSYNLIGATRNRLPWQITGIRVVFSAPITGGNINSLGGLSATGFSGLGTTTLTWNISPLSLGAFATTLSGTGANALTDAAGNPLANGAGFSQTLKVLWGDFDDDGFVTSADMVGVNNASVSPYDLFADENGDGIVNVADVQTVRSRLATSLP